jgi:pullulanase
VIAGPEDVSIYELHVRDFSASDDTVPEHLRGKYAAFNHKGTQSVTAGQQHLQELSTSGLTHVHLLPSYDFGSVPERHESQMQVALDLTQFAAGALSAASSFA